MGNEQINKINTYNAAEFTNEDFDVARSSWRKNLCGDKNINNIDVPGMDRLLEMIDADSRELRRVMNRSLESPVLFGNFIPTQSGELKPQYDRLLRLALPYGTYGCNGYKDKELLEDVLLGLEILYRNMYGENLLTDSSYRSYKLYDWWDWYSGAAQPLLDILMIISEDITDEVIKKYTTPVSFICTQMRQEADPSAAMSRISTMLPLALLTRDRAMLQSMYQDMETLLEKHDSGENMRRDWCCMTHGMPYNVAYGSLNMSRIAKIIKVLEGTPLAFNMKNKYDLMEMARYSFAPVMYRGKVFCAMNGRAIQRDDSAIQLLGDFHYLIGIFGDEEDKELKRIMLRSSDEKVKKKLLSTFDTGITLDEYREINTIPGRFSEAPKTSVTAYSIYRDVFDKAENDDSPYDIGYMWYSGDTAVQHRNGCMSGLRMCSERTPGYECINNENQDGWYTGDGALYLYTPESTEQYSPKWWKNADKHLIPGTTVDTRKRIPMCFYEPYKNSQSFVGGVSLVGEFITATMDYEAFHSEKDESRIDTGYGRGWPLHISTLNAQKSYFFFDRAIVALGTGINAKDGYGVRTVVENCILDKTLSVVFIDGKAIDLSVGEKNYNNIKSIHIPQRGSYFFLNNPLVTVKIYENNDVKYISVCIEHGVDPTDGNYAYIILPNCTHEESDNYSTDDIDICSFSSEIHCVREKHSGLTGIIFRKPSQIMGFCANQPMIAMFKEEDDRVFISVSEPTGKADCFYFGINKAIDVIEADEGIKWKKNENDLVFSIECNSARGRGYSLCFHDSKNIIT